MSIMATLSQYTDEDGNRVRASYSRYSEEGGMYIDFSVRSGENLVMNEQFELPISRANLRSIQDMVLCSREERESAESLAERILTAIETLARDEHDLNLRCYLVEH